MFGNKKKKQEEKQPAPQLSISTIPADFYGGKDPVIFQPKVSQGKPAKQEELKPEKKPEKKPELPPPSAEDHKIQKVSPMTQPKKPGKPVPPEGQKSNMPWIVGGGVFLLVVVGITAFYLWQAGIFEKPAPPPPQPPNIVVEQPPQEEEPPVEEPPTTTPEEEPIEPPRSVTPLVFPARSGIVASDIDGDRLTDIEEEVFNTDSGTWDMDGDGYYDGLEVVNLYNPRGTAPMLLVESGFVREYVSPAWQYRLYYPSAWQVDPVDNEMRQILVSAISGEYIEVRILPKPASQDFFSWFAAFGQDQQIQEYTQIENRFTIPVWRRSDGLVAFVPTDTAVYTIIYQPTPDGQILYPQVMEMLVQSFRPSRNAPALPPQPILPRVATTSPTSTSTTPALSPVPVAPGSPVTEESGQGE